MKRNAKYCLEIKNITKKYGATLALNDVSFNVKKGKIHTLLGENGAGKSTLVKLIMGDIEPTSGSILINGNKIEKYDTNFARGLGVSMVHQELAIFDNMTIAENIFPIHNFKNKLGLIDKAKLNQETQKKLTMFSMNISPKSIMSSLTLAEQQIVEILRSISLNQQIILLDEPTSGLNNQESKTLMILLKKLRNEGITIIYISHRINEILDISDEITVLRDGKYLGTYKNEGELTENILVNKMVGRECSSELYRQKKYRKTGDDIILEVNKLSKNKSIQDISFKLYRSQILGCFGLKGSGTYDLSKILYGLMEKDSGEVLLKGKKTNKITPSWMIENKIVYLNNNRNLAGLLLNMPLTDNMALPILEKISTKGFIRLNRLLEITKKFIKKFSIIISNIRDLPKTLSGGNQQKLMLAMCISPKPECIIINEPTRGIDVGAKAEIHKFLSKISEEGVSLILFSSDLPELLALADSIIVLKNKRLSGFLDQNEIEEQTIMSYAAMGTAERECVA